MVTKVEAIKKIMEENKGAVTWKDIYNNIEEYYPAAKVSKVWKEGLRGVLYREIKNKKNFKRIGLGIFALENYQEETKPIPKQKIRFHSFIEGCLLEMGNFKKFLTYTPDKTAPFKDNIFLNQIETINEFPLFTYPEIISIVKRIDVIWFNPRGFKFPHKVFEIVDSIGTLSESLNRCIQLKAFNLHFYIVAPEKYKEKVREKINSEPYFIFRERFSILNYEKITNLYEHAIKSNELKSELI
ncbi:MAG: hypothetical protein ABIG37_01310 [Nanoarchaeota archaeon]